MELTGRTKNRFSDQQRSHLLSLIILLTEAIPCRLLIQMYSWGEDYPHVCLKYGADLWVGFVLCLIGSFESASVLAQDVPHRVCALGMHWLCWCERTASLLEIVVWLLVKCMSALTVLLVNSVLLVIILDQPCSYKISFCSDLVTGFCIRWNSTCSCVHMSAHTLLRGASTDLFLLLCSFSPLSGLMATCDQYWSTNWHPHALLHYSTFFLWWIQAWNVAS